MSQTNEPPRGHPPGLATLFFTETWERFSFYGMRAIFVLYMGAAICNGGLGFSKEAQGAMLSMYMALVYVMALPGGWIADRFLGQRAAVLLGGCIIMLGHILLAIPALPSFYAGLGCLVIGTGFLKPNVSSMVGQLYPRGDGRRDGGFSIFYMGINIGAFVAPIICGWLAQSDAFRSKLAEWGVDPKHAWHFGFGAAAIGMLIGIVQFVIGSRLLGAAGKAPLVMRAGVSPEPGRLSVTPRERSRDQVILAAVIGGIAAMAGILVALHVSDIFPLNESRIANIFGILLAIVFVTTFVMLAVLARDSKERWGVLAMVVLGIGCTAFFALFEQAAGTMNEFASARTNNVAFGTEYPSSWMQSVNSVFVILLSPLFAWFFTWVVRRKLPFNDIAKFGVSLVLMAGAMAVMIPAASSSTQLADGSFVRVSPMYLLVFYFFSTVAELMLSPVGLSSMSKLAPLRASGLVMGVWFVATANGDYIAGRVHGLTGDVALEKLLLIITIGALVVAALVFGAAWFFTKRKPLESLHHDDDTAPQSAADSASDVPPAVGDVRRAVAGSSLAGFATALAVWPVVLTDPLLGLVMCAVLLPSAIGMSAFGLIEARRHALGGNVMSALGIVIGGLAVLAAIYFVLNPDLVAVPPITSLLQDAPACQ